jgi:hypothetical protein
MTRNNSTLNGNSSRINEVTILKNNFHKPPNTDIIAVKAVEIPFKAGGKINRNLVLNKAESMEMSCLDSFCNKNDKSKF